MTKRLIVVVFALGACGGGGKGDGGKGAAGTAGQGSGAAGAGGAGSSSGAAGRASGSGGSPPTTGPAVAAGVANPTYTCARELHVATTGSDAGDGSMAKPFKTISKVTPLARAGDCIQVHAGTYAEGSTITFAADGTLAAPIVLRSADGKLAAVIDAKTNRTGETVLVRNDYVVVDGFEFVGSPMDTEEQCVHFDGLGRGKGTGSVLRNSKLTAGYDTIKVNENSVGVTIEGNEIYGTFQHLPVSLTGASDLTFRGNFCHDWTLDGDGAIQIKGGSHDSLFEGNVFQDVHTSAGTIAMGDGCDATCDIDPEHYAAVRIRAVNDVFVRVGRGLDLQGCKDCAVLDSTFVDSGVGNVLFKLTSATTNGTTQATVGARILNNLVSNAGDGGNVVQINAPAGTGLVMDYNLRWNGGMAVSWGDGHPSTADAHSVTMDPELASTTDFSPGAGSAALGAGANLFAEVPIDFAGVARPMSGPFDIGAFQGK
ncbi:MAG TPA: choice-of-anchor Q domain-containing protein [Polyangia bacterium]|nr:choice-of-anchor Q domain-containing protein [Polyangia bacterium]